MIKLKRFITTFLSGLLCIAMVGCSNNSKENKDAEVRAEFQKAIEKYRELTFENYIDEFEVSDPSILSEETKEDYGDNFKSVNYKGTGIYEKKRDESNKITDYRILKESYIKTINYKDGSTKIKKVYIPGDGYKYIEKDGTKSKIKHTSSFRSFAHDSLNIDYIENITLTIEGDKKIFKFNYKSNAALDWFFGWGSYLRTDSDIKVKEFSGILTIDEKNNTAEEIMNEEYIDKKTGATAKGTLVNNCSNVNQELKFPKDLDSYKMAE